MNYFIFLLQISSSNGDHLECEVCGVALTSAYFLKRHTQPYSGSTYVCDFPGCGKKFNSQRVDARPGWQDVPAVKNGQLFEIKSADILQPGPAALTDGVDQLHRIILQWASKHG